MINKFENENEKEKLFKQKHASLIEHFMRTLDRISVSLYISKALYDCIRFHIKTYQYLKLS